MRELVCVTMMAAPLWLDSDALLQCVSSSNGLMSFCACFYIEHISHMKNVWSNVTISVYVCTARMQNPHWNCVFMQSHMCAQPDTNISPSGTCDIKIKDTRKNQTSWQIRNFSIITSWAPIFKLVIFIM